MNRVFRVFSEADLPEIARIWGEFRLINNPKCFSLALNQFFKPLSAKVMPQRFITPEGKDPLSEEAAILKQRKEVSAAFNHRHRKTTQ